MARTLTSATQVEALKRAGAEPFVFIEIDWGSGVGVQYYGDKTTTIGTIYVDGRIMDMSPIQSQVGVGDIGSSSVVSVGLSDSDLTLQTSLGLRPLEQRPAKIYHHFEGLDQTDLVVVLNGVVSGPIEWDEKNRLLRFQIEAVTQSETIGYSPEDGDISGMSPDAIGKVWPVCFGTVIDVPGVLVKRSPRGRLAGDVDVNATEFDVILDNTDQPFPVTVAPNYITMQVAEELIEGTFVAAVGTLQTFTIVNRNLYRYEPTRFDNRPIADPDVDDAHVAWVLDETERLVGNYVIVPAIDVPYANTDKYNYCIAQQGTKVWFQWPWGSGIINNAWLFTATSPTNGANVRAFLDNAVFRVLKAGSPVIQFEEAEDVFVVNEFASTEVLRVRAWKTIQYNSTGATYEELVDVPEDYYTVDLSDSSLGAPGGRTPTTITFTTRLSMLGTWKDDQVFVSIEAVTGPNTADIIEWILNNYSGLTPDTTTFATVQTALTKYPSHFAILESVDAVRTCAEIAWQARCGLFTVGEEAYLRYLSTEPPGAQAAVTLDVTSDNVLEDAQITFTDTEDIVTVFEALWKPLLSDLDNRRISYEANTDLFGHRRREFEFWIYQTESLVIKSATFWAQRYARSWYNARVRAFLDALALDILDSVTLNIPALGLPEVTTVTQQVAHDTAQHIIALELWTPVEAGTQVASAYAWVDDSGDVAPDDPSIGVNPAPEETQSVPPLIINSPFADGLKSQTVPAKVDVETGTGEFRVVTYPSGYSGAAGDTVIVSQIGDTDLEDDDEILASQTPDGSWFATKGGGSSGSRMAVGQVISHSGTGPTSTYLVYIYDNGIDQTKTETITAYPLTIATGHAFKAGTWALFVWIELANGGNGRWYFQPPVWLPET